MKHFLRRQFLHLAAGAAALPAVSHVARASLSDAAGARPGGLSSRRRERYLRAADRAITSERLGQPFIIENRVGAGSTIAADAVVQSAPDGYTFLLTAANDAYNPSLYPNLKYDFMRDFAPIASIAFSPQVLEVNPLVPAKTVPEFIAYARSNPGKINYASAGVGTTQHLCGELFQAVDRREHGSCPLSRRRASGCGPNRGTSAGHD